MIIIFNRKQLLLTYDMKLQAKVREILAVNKIDYYFNPISMSWNTSRASKAEYKIYVKKSDYEEAQWLIRDVLRG